MPSLPIARAVVGDCQQGKVYYALEQTDWVENPKSITVVL